MPFLPPFLTYHLIMFAWTLGSFYIVYRWTQKNGFLLSFLKFWLIGCLNIAFLIGLSFHSSVNIPIIIEGRRVCWEDFFNLQLFDEGLFIFGTLFWLVSAWLINCNIRKNGKQTRFFRVGVFFMVLGGLFLIGLGIDTHFYEPTALQVKNYEIMSPKIKKPLRIVFVADIQADRISDYERKTLELIKAQKPDLVLLGGDYIQPSYYSLDLQGNLIDFEQELTSLLQGFASSFPLGVLAVSGNNDLDIHRCPIEKVFKNVGISYNENNQSFVFEHDFLRVSCIDHTDIIAFGAPDILNDFSPKKQTINDQNTDDLSKDESEKNKTAESDQFHIILCHFPGSLERFPWGDLHLTGHTHGGQICLPFYGPITTNAPGMKDRTLTYGSHVLSNGAFSIASNGSGMERGTAPRVRMLCRPDIIVVDLKPGKTSEMFQIDSERQTRKKIKR